MMRSTKGYFLCAYSATLIASLWLSYQLRFDFSLPTDVLRAFPLCLAWMLSLKLLSLWRFRQFAVLPRFFSTADFLTLSKILFGVSAIALVISSQLGWKLAPPRGVIVADFSLSLIGLTGVRLALGSLSARSMARQTPLTPFRARRAGIVGAGLVGGALAQEFASRPELRLQAVAFFDDDRTKWGTRIHDIPVVGAPEVLENDATHLELEEVIIAMPSAPGKRVAAVVELLKRLQLNFKSVPSFYELTTGRAKVSQLRAVPVDELLGRDQIELATESVREILWNRTVMVTGAGGSIGSELCRQIAASDPSLLVLVEQSEVQLFQIEQELRDSGHGGSIVALVANVMDRPRIDHLLERYSPSVVFHAAAHKHVPIMERQPGEAIKNNAWGTLQLAEACLHHRVERFVLISSDKAINPTNVMGATKRLAEMCVQSLHAAHPLSTRFMAVRFGNVLGSSGSVVPIFNKQIAAGGPVTVTHPEVTRYFMTIPEAVGLVLQSAALGQGGEIFILDMGEPVRILDLARQLIELSGFTPDRDIRIEFTGLRPGEKLFEELNYQGESITATHHPKILRLICEPHPLKAVRDALGRLMEQADRRDSNQLKRLLSQVVAEYKPQFQEIDDRELRSAAPAGQANIHNLKEPRPEEPNSHAQFDTAGTLLELDKPELDGTLEVTQASGGLR
jgi:FlaA1/EpsC-like NDP-sugar epimerase